MVVQPRYLPHYTYKDYCQWEGQWELIDGIPVARNPLPVIPHQIVCGNLYKTFKTAMKGQSQPCVPCLSVDWKLNESTVVRPDFLVIDDPSPDEGPITAPPILVAEILSPSTALLDRKAKFSLYELKKVKYCLIIETGSNKLEIYQLVDDLYQPMAINPPFFEFIFHDDCKVNVPFDELWD